MNAEIAWWEDEPARHLDDDRFARAPFVARVRVALDRVASSNSSTVVGLVGPWGSGKTSIVNFVDDALDPEMWNTVTFTPWATNSRDGLVAEFYAALGSAYKSNTTAAKKALDAINSAAAFMIPLLSLVPGAGQAADMAGRVRDSLEKPLSELLDQLAKELPKDGPSTLVIVDDIDRLQPAELMLIFQLVRLLGRLPRVHYLIAYDEQTILDSIARTEIANDQPVRALAYLEKIVQLKLDIPPLNRLQAEHGLSDALEAVFAREGVQLSPGQVERFKSLYQKVLSHSLNQPRKIRRFVAQVAIYLPLVGVDEVDVVDFLCLTHIRSEFPDLYRWILRNADLLTSREEQAELAAELRESFARLVGNLNRPGVSGDSVPWEGWSHGRKNEVSGRAA